LEAALFGGLWKVFETSSAAGRLARGNTQRPSGSRAAGRVSEAVFFGESWKMLSAKYEVDRGPRQSCWRSDMEWCSRVLRSD
jgi:hypothetical protein